MPAAYSLVYREPVSQDTNEYEQLGKENVKGIEEMNVVGQGAETYLEGSQGELLEEDFRL